ncbi:NAD(P)-dependent dehydrogenase, short-chain alcohol dehydrogenase family [Rhizobiales bacterium GAS188]|nr:NAD(P)-dependent dehydrogenase, short-chain alcohol dehydrogenase family [Rhizobiales bacterium GAS188]
MSGAVLVTGARRGIGRAIAYAFAAAGRDIVVNDLVEDAAARETLDMISERGARACFLQGDIGDLSSTEALVEKAFAAFGNLDVLINNAGISVARRGDMLETSPESFDRLIAVNLRGPFFLTQAVARRWLGESGSRSRAIVNIASANAHMASIDRAEYCLSKAGVAMMTKLYAVRLADAGIGVFEIRPGVIRTDMTAVAAERYDRLIAGGLTPVRRWGEPEDIGRVAVALASGDFHFSTGETVHVDGGLHIARL